MQVVSHEAEIPFGVEPADDKAGYPLNDCADLAKKFAGLRV